MTRSRPLTGTRSGASAGDGPALLARFDAAPATMYDDVAVTRAQARLEQILATDPLHVRDQAVVPRRPRRTARAMRFAAIPALAVAALVASVVLPGGRGAAPAFAGWTPTPTVVPSSALAAIERECSRSIDALVTDPEVFVSDRLARSIGSPALLVAEQRGDFGVAAFVGEGRTVALLGEATTTALCLTYGPPGSPVVAQVVIQDSAPWAGTTITSTSPDMPFVTDWSGIGPRLSLDPGEVSLTAVMGGQMGTEGSYTIVDGVVGPDVVGVSLLFPGRREAVEATVSGGHFVAWIPGSLHAPGTRSPLDDLTNTVTTTLTLADGTVRENVSFTTG